MLNHWFLFSKDVQQPELPWLLIAVTKERILSVLAETLFAVMAQEMRSRLSRRLYGLTPIIDERMRICSLATESLICRLWNEMAVLKLGFV